MADWIPLESNPEIINEYIVKLGIEPTVEFIDVLGLDDMLLDMLPEKVYAYILLFPISDKYLAYVLKEQELFDSYVSVSDSSNDEKNKSSEAKSIVTAEKESTTKQPSVPESLFFMNQTVSNACGTIGILHALANNKEIVSIKKDSIFDKFLNSSNGKSSKEIAQVLEQDVNFADAHKDAAAEGNEFSGEKVDLHFVAILEHKNVIYELDGRKTKPIAHGEFPENANFKKIAGELCKKFMLRDPDELRFTMLALCKKEN